MMIAGIIVSDWNTLPETEKWDGSHQNPQTCKSSYRRTFDRENNSNNIVPVFYRQRIPNPPTLHTAQVKSVWSVALSIHNGTTPGWVDPFINLATQPLTFDMRSGSDESFEIAFSTCFTLRERCPNTAYIDMRNAHSHSAGFMPPMQWWL